MSNVINLTPKSVATTKATSGAIVERWETVVSYGEIGPVRVVLARRLDEASGCIHVVVIGSSSFVVSEPVATLSDDATGRAIADVTGPAVVRAIEHAEVEFTCQPEAC